MKSSLRYALLAGAALVAVAGAAAARMDPQTERGPASRQSQYAQKLLADFDLNKDGKITRDEMNKVAGQRFATASGGGAVISAAQFQGAQQAKARARTGEMFRRIDWNGDGKVSLDEFATPIRAQFQKLDRDGKGTVACAPAPKRDAKTLDGKKRGRGGAGKLCREADLNKDGRLTRGELDKSTAQRFSATAKGGPALTLSQFASLNMARTSRGQSFERLDQNQDGKLDRAEFTVREARLFARLDRNNDGAITQDEMRTRRTNDRGKHGRG